MLFALLLVLAPGAENARAVSADEYLFVPTVTQGEREIDWHFGIASPGGRVGSQTASGLAFGVGVTQHWFTELDVEFRRRSGKGSGLDSVEWENILQIGETGQWPVDVGLVFNIEKSKDAAEGWSIRAGPLLQKDFGKFEANLNFLAGREFPGTGTPTTQLGYQAQVKYRYSQPLEVGIQAFGRLSSGGQSLASRSEQAHRVGPVVLGRFVFARERSLAYNIAYLMGTTPRSSDETLRLQVEYEF